MIKKNFAGISNPFTFTYRSDSNLPDKITYPNGMIRQFGYEDKRDLIKSLEHSYTASIISKHEYTHNITGRRTKVKKTGTAFAQHTNGASTLNYGYNDRGKVVSAAALNDSAYNYGYSFDNIGNRMQTTAGAETVTYQSNNLNQYSSISSPVSPVVNPEYNADGCMTAKGDWTYTWNCENRLIEAVKGDKKLTFIYDCMGRRINKKVYSKTGDSYQLIPAFSTTAVLSRLVLIKQMIAVKHI